MKKDKFLEQFRKRENEQEYSDNEFMHIIMNKGTKIIGILN